MLAPLTGVVSLGVGYLCLLIYSLWGNVNMPQNIRDRLLRPTLGYAPLAALVFGAMALGQTVDPDEFVVKLLFKDGVFFWVNPAVGVAIGVLVYFVPLLRFLLLSWFCYVFGRQRSHFDFSIRDLALTFAAIVFLLAGLVNINVDFPLTEAEYERRLDWNTRP